jgi:broad specificity phosphatase PhoE
MKLIIVRHGETMENVNNISMGHIDGTLTTLGQSQVEKLGQRLKDEKIDFIYCSDLGRNKDTLKEIAEFHQHVPVVYDPLLRERSKGIYEGLPKTVLAEVREKTGMSKFDYRPEGGENFHDVKERVDKFINELFKKHSDSETILLVTHGGWKNSFMSYLMNLPFEESVGSFQFKNTSVSVFSLTKDMNYQIHLVNCTKHLDGFVLADQFE